MNKMEKIFLIHALKNQEVLFKIRDKNAKGVSKIKIFKVMYLNEYVKTRFNKEAVNVVLIRPLRENISIEDVLKALKLFKLKINSEKQIFLPNRSSPILLIASEI